MSDSQFGALITVLVTFLTGLIGMLKWAAGRLVKALDDNTAAGMRDTEAKIKLASELAVFSTKIDHVTDFVEKHTPVQGVPVSPQRAPSGLYHIPKQKP